MCCRRFLVFCYLTRFGVISPCLPFFTLPLPLCASRLCGVLIWFWALLLSDWVVDVLPLTVLCFTIFCQPPFFPSFPFPSSSSNVCPNSFCHANRLAGDLTTTNSLPRSVRAGQAAASGGQPTTTTAEGAHFREIFAEDFAPGPRRGSLSGSLSDGYGHPSEGTDGSGSDSGGGGYYAAASSSNVRGKKAQYVSPSTSPEFL